MGKCVAPCQLAVSREEYGELANQAWKALSSDVRPVLDAASRRVSALAAQQRFEECAEIGRRIDTYVNTSRRHHRVASLAGCEIVAAKQVSDAWGKGCWEVHAFSKGRLVGAELVHNPNEVQGAADALLGFAPLPEAEMRLPEEAELIADWLEQPGVRLLHVEGEWAWPLHAAASEPYLRVG
jgi:DNA polymerase-3 subunit epsilon